MYINTSPNSNIYNCYMTKRMRSDGLEYYGWEVMEPRRMLIILEKYYKKDGCTVEQKRKIWDVMQELRQRV